MAAILACARAALVLCIFCFSTSEGRSTRSIASSTHKLRRAAAGARKPKSPFWFGGMAEGETTYDIDAAFETDGPGNPYAKFQDGWEPEVDGPSPRTMQESEFFHESPSNGAKGAWMTHPTPKAGLVNADLGHPWVRHEGGSWSQQYVSGVADREERGEVGLDAAWFDASAVNTDTFGRKRLPSLLSPQRYGTWSERSVNTTLACSDPGCTASTTLQLYDLNAKEQVTMCKLSLAVHVTDFDSPQKGEYVEWVTINGVQVSTKCSPGENGCDPKRQRALYPCITEFPLTEDMIPYNGSLSIVAKIPPLVDDCPYQGNMLSAVPMVTCLVAPQNPSPMFGQQQGNVITVAGDNATFITNGANGTNGDSTSVQKYVANLPLKCPDLGCAASATLYFPTSVSLENCKLAVVVNQTDFDNPAGAEVIEYIAVGGVNAATNVQPGKNPCTAKAQGSPLPKEEMTYQALDGHDISAEVASGTMIITAKITDEVDDCKPNGYLLDALATVTCDVAGPAASPAAAASQPAANASLLQRGATLPSRPRRLRLQSTAA